MSDPSGASGFLCQCATFIFFIGTSYLPGFIPTSEKGLSLKPECARDTIVLNLGSSVCAFVLGLIML